MGSDGNTTGAEPDTASITINGTVNNDLSLCTTTLTDTASVSTTTLESNLNNNSATADTSVNPCQGSLRLIKAVTTDNGGNANASDFNLHVKSAGVDVAGSPQAGSATGTVYALASGTYTVSEDAPPTGYTQTSVVCDGQNTNLVTVVPGQEKLCTITNDDQPGTLIVKKVFVGEVGDPTQFSFKVNDNDLVAFEADGQNDLSVNAGLYNITEPVVSGYTTSYSNCSNVNVDNGESETCTITNTKLPTLTLNKILQNNSVVTETGLFDLKIDGITYATNVGDGGSTGAVVVALGEHTVSESAGTGTDLSLYDQVTGGHCLSNGSITLSAGENKVCTITNTRKTGKILIDKILFGDEGPADESDWEFIILGQSFYDGDFVILPIGTYDITENQDILGYTLSSVGGVCSVLNGSTATLTVSQTTGENYDTCSFTNTRDKGVVVVNKLVDSDNDGVYEGGNTEANLLGFTWSLSGGSQNAMGTNVDNVPTTIDGVSHTVNENTISGYRFTGWYPTGSTAYSCVNPQGTTLPVSITVVKDQTTSITLCNARETGSIVVHKDVTGPNGEALIDDSEDFTVTLDGNNSKTITDGETVTYTNVPTGTHTIAESSIPDGYELVSITTSTPTVNYSQTTDVYVVNRQKPAKLTLVKNLPNDNGGTAVVADFPVFIDSNAAVWGDNTLNPGTYVVSETTQTGYAPSDWGNGCTAGGSVSLLPGQTKTCQITNDDIAPTLKLVKNVTADNNGNETAASWTLSATGEGGFSDLGSSTTFHTVKAGVGYILSESSIPGYTANSWSCDGGVLNGSTLTLGLNDDVTCQITNDDIAPSLTVIKHVSNDDGGNANITDFDLEINDVDLSFGAGSLSNLVMSYTANPSVLANISYTLTELDLPGYNEGSWSCLDNDTQQLVTHPFILTEGQNLTCTITNDDIAPTITLNKIVVGGSASEDSFGLTIGATSVTSGQTLTVAANTPHALNETGSTGYSFTSLTGDPKCPTSLGETVTLDEDEDISCTITNTRDTGSIIVHKLIDRDGSTITTDDRSVAEDWTVDVNGVSNDTSDPISQPTNASGSATFSNLKTGTYNVLETQKPGYELIDAYCDQEAGSPDGETIYSVDLTQDQTISCTFVNSPNGVLHGRKWSDQDGQGDFNETDLLSGWTINLYQDNGGGYDLIDSQVTDNSAHYGWYWFEHLFPGDYKICEVSQAGYTQTYPAINDGCYLVSLPTGTSSPSVNQEVLNYVTGPAYDFGNAPLTDVHGYKWDDVNGNGERDEEELLGGWTIFLDTNSNSLLDDNEKSTTTDNNPESEHYGWYWFYDLFPGEYTICEVQQSGWQQTYPISKTDNSCHTLTVPNQNTQTENAVVGPEYHFGNQSEPELLLKKTNNTTGNKNPGDLVTFTLTLDLTGSALNSIIVTDVTPDGFVYVPGSYTARKNGTPLSITEPAYASPGIWELGEMINGDQIILTYQAKIDANQDGGTYYDLAWAKGENRGWGTILALGHDSSFVDEIFVGTSVSVNQKVSIPSWQVVDCDILISWLLKVPSMSC